MAPSPDRQPAARSRRPSAAPGRASRSAIRPTKLQAATAVTVLFALLLSVGGWYSIERRADCDRRRRRRGRAADPRAGRACARGARPTRSRRVRTSQGGQEDRAAASGSTTSASPARRTAWSRRRTAPPPRTSVLLQQATASSPPTSVWSSRRERTTAGLPGRRGVPAPGAHDRSPTTRRGPPRRRGERARRGRTTAMARGHRAGAGLLAADGGAAARRARRRSRVARARGGGG